MVPLLLSLLLTPSAHAADWSDFADAFPTLPCSDGWAACVVGSEPVSPEPGKDEVGVPTPGDLRVGWFSLESRPAFDPFPSLSRYSGDPAPKAAADPTPQDEERRLAVLDAEEVRTVPGDGTPPERREQLLETTRTEPRTSIQALVTEPRPEGGPDEDREARIAVTRGGPTSLEDCGPRTRLEPKAMLGQLTEPQRACLDAVASNLSLRATVRSKASWPLLVDARSSDRPADWERLARRHLDEIERSEPYLALGYAIHLYRRGADASAVVQWSDVALDNRTQWTGDDYVHRTETLRGLKARAAGKRWQALEEAKARGEAVDPGELQRWRTSTVTFAREWYDYARSAGKRTDKALALCISAAGTEDACR